MIRASPEILQGKKGHARNVYSAAWHLRESLYTKELAINETALSLKYVKTKSR